MATGIPIDQLPKDVRKQLGVDGIDSHVIALSRVLDSIRNVQSDDAVWALRKALEMLAPKDREEPKDFVSWVIAKVAEAMGFAPEDILKRSRSPDLVVARQTIMYVLWRSDRYTLTEIGKKLGGRSAATVSHGAAQSPKLLQENPQLNEIVEELLNKEGA